MCALVNFGKFTIAHNSSLLNRVKRHVCWKWRVPHAGVWAVEAWQWLLPQQLVLQEEVQFPSLE